MKKITVLSLGVCDYESTRLKQRELRTNLINGGTEFLISCQHNPVITYGKSKLLRSLLSNQEDLNKSGYELHEVERGGDITCHEPGQLILYPVIDLTHHKKDVAWYMRELEQVIINTLNRINLKSIRIEGKTGVWMSKTEKVASIGVSLSRWCTMHGLAINISNSMAGFQHITPCGLSNIQMVKLDSYSNCTLLEFEALLIEEFKLKFGY